MATTLPRVHVAFMGMERIVADLADHDILLRLLSMGAAAQDMAGYVSYIGGPAEKGRTDGPDAFHLIIVDNGRSRILADPDFREMLCCIRCGACLNMCPVYGKSAGMHTRPPIRDRSGRWLPHFSPASTRPVTCV
jgi:L-lactate dehydrogenase complex protein LldF